MPTITEKEKLLALDILYLERLYQKIASSKEATHQLNADTLSYEEKCNLLPKYCHQLQDESNKNIASSSSPTKRFLVLLCLFLLPGLIYLFWRAISNKYYANTFHPFKDPREVLNDHIITSYNDSSLCINETCSVEFLRQYCLFIPLNRGFKKEHIAENINSILKMDAPAKKIMELIFFLETLNSSPVFETVNDFFGFYGEGYTRDLPNNTTAINFARLELFNKIAKPLLDKKAFASLNSIYRYFVENPNFTEEQSSELKKISTLEECQQLILKINENRSNINLEANLAVGCAYPYPSQHVPLKQGK